MEGIYNILFTSFTSNIQKPLGYIENRQLFVNKPLITIRLATAQHPVAIVVAGSVCSSAYVILQVSKVCASASFTLQIVLKECT